MTAGLQPVSVGAIKKAGLSRSYWIAMAISFFTFWVLDLLTSGILIWSGFGYLEGNVSVRSFFTGPTFSSLLVFLENQAIYLVPLLVLLAPPAFNRLSKGEPRAEFYLLSGVLAFSFAAERLNLGIASNTANLIAVADGLSVPASGSLYLLLWGTFDLAWAASIVAYLLVKRGGTRGLRL